MTEEDHGTSSRSRGVYFVVVGLILTFMTINDFRFMLELGTSTIIIGAFIDWIFKTFGFWLIGVTILRLQLLNEDVIYI